MDEIYQLVRIRISKIHELNKALSAPNDQLKVEDIRKAKEDEKFRTEKENWILNVLKALKDYTFEQKQILCEKSLDIMKLIWPEFQLKTQLYYDEEFNRKFLDIYLRMFTEFFQPFEQTYEFRLTLRQVARPNNISMVPDMLKYLVEFSRDCFKKFMIFLSIQRNQQQGTIQQQQNPVQNKAPTNQNGLQGMKASMRSKSSISNNLATDNQQNNTKSQISKVGIVISNDIPQADPIIALTSPRTTEQIESNIEDRRKSMSLHQKNEDVKLLGNILKQVNQEQQSSQQLKKIETLPLQKEKLQQQIESEVANKVTDKDNVEIKDYSTGKQLNSENDPVRRKSLLAKQSQQTTSSPLRFVQNKKIGPSEGNVPDEKTSPRLTPNQLYYARSPLRLRLNNQTNNIQSQSTITQTYNPAIKKQDLSVFPSTLCISWFISKEKEIKITRQTNANSVITDIDSTNIQAYNEKMKRAKGGLEDMKLMFIQIYEQAKQRNSFINSTVQIYHEKYKNRYPKKIKQLNEERDKEDRELFPSTIQSYQAFQAYYFTQNEDMFSSQKKNEQGNFAQISAQKMFIVKSAASKNRKQNSSALTPPPSSQSNSILNIINNQRSNNSAITTQQNISNSATPVQQTSSTIINQQNQAPYNICQNTTQNSNIISKPKTVSCLSQVPSFTTVNQQQQRTVSPSKYHKVDHTNPQNKLKIIRLTNSRCNSAIMRPKISSVATPISSNQQIIHSINNNNMKEKILDKTPASCYEIKLSSKINDYSTADQSQMFRQKSNSVIDVLNQKNSSEYQQSLVAGNALDVQQSRSRLYLQGGDFIIKTHSVQELDDEIDDLKFKEENSVMDASFALPHLNSKASSPRKTADVINIQDENEAEQQNSIIGVNNTPINVLHKELNQSGQEISKFDINAKSQLQGEFSDDLHYSPTNESPGYFILSKIKKKGQKNPNEQQMEQSENKRSQSKQGQQVPTNLRELTQSPHVQKDIFSKTQRTNSNNQQSFNYANSVNPFSYELENQISSKLCQQQQFQYSNKTEDEKLIQKKNSADGSQSSSSASSSISQNIGQSQINQQNNKQINFRFQGNINYMCNANNSENIFSNQVAQENKLPQINQSGSKGGISYGGTNEIKIMQQNEEENIKSRNRNYSNQPYVKKVQDYSNILINCANQNIQKEYMIGNQNNGNQNNNFNANLQNQQNTFASNSRINLPNNQQLTEDYMKNYPQNLNVMTDKFKNLLLQKISKIKGDKQQQLAEQIGNNPNGIVLGGTNGIPLKVLQQQQMQTSNILTSQVQQQQIVSISQSKIIQKYSNNNNLINANSIISSTQPSRQNHFNSQISQNQENKSRPPSNNQIDNEMKILSQISNTMPIRKSKNISFSVDNQAQIGMNHIKVINQKFGQQINNNNNNQQSTTPDVLQQLLTQPKNSTKDIFTNNQTRQKQSQHSFSISSKKMQHINPQKNYQITTNQIAASAAQQITMNISNITNNNPSNQNTQLKTGQNALQNLIGSTNTNIQKSNGGFNMKLLKVQGNTINNEKRQEGQAENKATKNIQVQDITKQFTSSFVTQLQPFFQQHQISLQK